LLVLDFILFCNELNSVPHFSIQILLQLWEDMCCSKSWNNN